MACMCMGPQRGEPLCPCMMRAAQAHIVPSTFVAPPLDLDKVFDLLILARNSKDEEALQEAINIVATASCRSPISVARMILEEMMEPTPEMLDAAIPALVRYIEDSLGFSDRDAASEVWKAMVGCALRDRRLG